MQTIIFRVLIVVLLIFIAVPVQATSLVQVWSCTLNEGKTMADMDAINVAWLKAVRSMKGGEEFELHINYPVSPGGTAINGVIIAPSFEAWGAFSDGYFDSPAMKVDKEMAEILTCSGGNIWASVEVKVE